MKIKSLSLLYLVLATALYAVIPKIHSPGAAQDYRDAPRSVNTTALDPNLQKVAIYGKTDDRKEPANSTEIRSRVAESTVFIASKRSLTYDSQKNQYTEKQVSLGESYGLDSKENFLEQPALLGSSGVLVGKDIVLAAGHSFWPMEKRERCEDHLFIFDYNTTNYPDAKNPLFFPAENVYECKRIIAHKVQNMSGNFFCLGDKCEKYPPATQFGTDYAIIQLTKPVDNRLILAVNRNRPAAEINEPIFMAGYPSGLPLKVTDNASVISISTNGYFENDLDGFAGNSGGPVFSAKTLKIIGVFVRAPAYQYLGGRTWKADINTPYSQATLSSEFSKYIPVSEMEQGIDAILERKSKRKFEKDGNEYKIVPAISFPGSTVTPEPAVFHPKPAPAVQPKNGI